MIDSNVAEHERRVRIGEGMAAERARQKLSLDGLAVLAGLDEKTVRTALRGGPVRWSSILSICRVLGVDPELEPKKPRVAGEKFGSYNSDHYSDCIGGFFVYRRSLSNQDNILRTLFKIKWSEPGEESRLTFKEFHKYNKEGKIIDYSQDGDIYINNKINIVQLLTSMRGGLRLISLTRMEDHQKSMSGIVATNAHVSFFNQPSAAAILFQKIEEDTSDAELEECVGLIYPGDSSYVDINGKLKDIEQRIGLFAIQKNNIVSNFTSMANDQKSDMRTVGGRSQGGSRSHGDWNQSGVPLNRSGL